MPGIYDEINNIKNNGNVYESSDRDENVYNKFLKESIDNSKYKKSSPIFMSPK
jgi:hypothetical protein